MQHIHLPKTIRPQQFPLIREWPGRVLPVDLIKHIFAHRHATRRFQIFGVSIPHHLLNGGGFVADQIGDPDRSTRRQNPANFFKDGQPVGVIPQVVKDGGRQNHVEERVGSRTWQNSS